MPPIETDTSESPGQAVLMTPRQKFVEAMKFLYETSAGGPQGCPDAIDESIRAACEAFADAECRTSDKAIESVAFTGMCDSPDEHKRHRATILKEVIDESR